MTLVKKLPVEGQLLDTAGMLYCEVGLPTYAYLIQSILLLIGPGSVRFTFFRPRHLKECKPDSDAQEWEDHVRWDDGAVSLWFLVCAWVWMWWSLQLVGFGRWFLAKLLDGSLKACTSCRETLMAGTSSREVSWVSADAHPSRNQRHDAGAVQKWAELPVATEGNGRC